MKIYTLLIAAMCTFGLTLPDAAFAKSKKVSKKAVCEKIVKVPAGKKFIYKNSAPIRSGGVGTPLVGFRKEPTLILLTKGFSKGSTVIYDSLNNEIGSCPWATAHDAPGGRYRCTMSTPSLRKAAMKRTNSPKIRFRLNATTCAEVTDAGRCYGSVKGLCNQLIK